VVEVEGEHAARLLRVAAHPLEFRLEAFHETAPVGQPGEKVGARLLPKLAREPDLFGNVLQARVGLADRAVDAQRLRIHPDPDIAATGYGDAHHDIAHRFPGAQGHLRRMSIMRKLGPILGNRPPSTLDRLLTLQLREAQTKDAQRRRVGAAHPPLRVEPDQTEGDGVDEHPVPLIAFAQPGELIGGRRNRRLRRAGCRVVGGPIVRGCGHASSPAAAPRPVTVPEIPATGTASAAAAARQRARPITASTRKIA